MKSKKGTLWSEEEIEFIRLNYDHMTKKELGSKLGRTESAVIDKAHLIGIGRKNLNSRFNKETRICVICKNEFPRTSEYFTTFIAKRDKEVFQNKCRPCEKVYVQEKNSTLTETIKGILRGIEKSKKRTNKGFELTLEFLLDLWSKQGGMCALTGIQMTHTKGKGTHYFSNLSVDRIDSNLGYIKNNVQLVCMWSNGAKGTFTMEEFKNIVNITNCHLTNGVSSN